MFSENLRTLRKQKGFSQEELAARLHVVRQTISKWEKSLSVPDADALIRLADILEVTVTELLGEKVDHSTDTDNIAEQLSRINEQLAIKNRRARRLWKAIGIILALIVIFQIIVLLLLRADVSTSGSQEIDVLRGTETRADAVNDVDDALQEEIFVIYSGTVKI